MPLPMHASRSTHGQEEEAKCCVATNPCVEKTFTGTGQSRFCPGGLGGEIAFDSTSPTRCGFRWIEADQGCHAENSRHRGARHGADRVLRLLEGPSLGYTFCYVQIYPRAQRIRKKKAQRNSRRVTSARGLMRVAGATCTSDCREESCACDGAQGASCCAVTRQHPGCRRTRQHPGCRRTT